MLDGIPPSQASDSEDVVWALQTADALWKRNERVDAIVWLRRAAQAAGEAEDDDRALVLARNAAELTELMARRLAAAPLFDRAPPAAASGSTGGDMSDLRPPLPDSSNDSDTMQTAAAVMQTQAESAPALPFPEPVDLGGVETPRVPIVDASDGGESSPNEVPTAAQAHAGLLDP